MDLLRASQSLRSLKRGIGAPQLLTTCQKRTQAFTAALNALQMTAEKLLSQPQATLQSLILYHALDTAVASANVPEEPTEVTTVA